MDQPKNNTIMKVRMISKRNWNWYLMDFLMVTIKSGKRCRNKIQARAKCKEARDEYLKTLKPEPPKKNTSYRYGRISDNKWRAGQKIG